MIRLLKKMDKGRVTTAVVFMVIQVMGMLALPTLTAAIIDNGVSTGDIGYIQRIGLVMLGVSLMTITSAFINVYYASRESQGLGHTLRKELYRKVMYFSNEELDDVGTATLITRTTNDVMQVQLVAMMMLRMMIIAPIMMLGAGTMAVIKEPKLSMIFIVALPILLAILGVILKFANPFYKVLQEKTDGLNRIFREGLTGIRVIRAFNKSDYEEKRFDAANQEFANTSKKAMSTLALLFPVMTVTTSILNVSILWFGAKFINAQQMQVGSLVAFLTYAAQILIGVINLSFVLFVVPRGQVSAKRINEVLDIEKTIFEPEVSAKPRQTAQKDLAFNHVNFRYRGAEKLALKDIDFHAKVGETVAIIGGTGSGKTTLANLIPRFYDIESGSIEIGGVNIKEMTHREIRSELGFAPQKALLFTGTIRENMQYGNPGATDEDIWKALEIAQGKEFVSQLPNGLDSYVEQGGGNFSGGQRQRLSIARALVTDANIFIFDDSFSALDFKTDAKLRKALKPATKDAVVVIIAQRISTVIDADIILLLDNGQLVGKGTHEELKETNAIYQEIMASQMRGEDI